MTQTYRVGIIGCGSGMGRSHASAYTQNSATTLVAAAVVYARSLQLMCSTSMPMNVHLLL